MSIKLDFEFNNPLLEEFLLTFRALESRRNYRREIMQFMRFTGKPFDEITVEECRQYVDHLMGLTMLPEEHPRHKKLTTVEKIYSYLYSFYSFLHKFHGEFNPFNLVEKPRADREVSPTLIIPRADFNRLLAVLQKGPLMELVAMLLIFTSGLWPNEIVELKWNRFIQDAHNNIGIRVAKRGQETRYKAVHPDVWKILMQLRIEMGNPPADSYVFLNRRDLPYTDRKLRRILESACREAGLPAYPVKSLRHTFALRSLEDGADAAALQEHLGWETAHYADKYLRVMKELEESPVKKLKFDLAKGLPTKGEDKDA